MSGQALALALPPAAEGTGNQLVNLLLRLLGNQHATILLGHAKTPSTNLLSPAMGPHAPRCDSDAAKSITQSMGFESRFPAVKAVMGKTRFLPVNIYSIIIFTYVNS